MTTFVCVWCGKEQEVTPLPCTCTGCQRDLRFIVQPETTLGELARELLTGTDQALRLGMVRPTDEPDHVAVLIVFESSVEADQRTVVRVDLHVPRP